MKKPIVLLCCAVLYLSSLSQAGHYLGDDRVNQQDGSESQVNSDRQHPQDQDAVQFHREDIEFDSTDLQRSKRKTAKESEPPGKDIADESGKSDAKPTTATTKSPKTKATTKAKSDSSSKKKSQLQQKTTAKPKEMGTATAPDEDNETSTPKSDSSTTTTTPSTSTQGNAATTTTSSKPVADSDIYCMCDMLRNACDMNCCCDRECSKEDQHFFTHCTDQVIEIHDVSLARRQRSCYRSFVTFKHKNVYEDKVRNENGMLCVVRDNNKFDNILPAVKVEELNERIRKSDINVRPKYLMNPDLQQMIRWEPYKYGSPILAAKEIDLEKNKAEIIFYGLPTAYHALSCTKLKEPIRFLDSSVKDCRFLLSNLSEDCMKLGIINAEKFIKLQIVKNPAKEESFRPISITKVCRSGVCSSNQFDTSATEPILTPTWNKLKSRCQNVLTGLNLTFLFDVEGITEVLAEVELNDLSTSAPTKGPLMVVQKYRATFVLDDGTNKTVDNGTLRHNYTEAIPKSGNPGYIVGKPVIMGEKIIVKEEVQKDSEDGVTETPEESEVEIAEKEVVLVWKDPNRWMSIHGPGLCSKNPSEPSSRKSVLFDYSHITMCSLNLTNFKQCDDLQRYISKVLLGVDDPEEFGKKSWQVAAFGNSDPNIPTEWVPVTFKNFPIQTQGNSKGLVSKGCDSIVSSLKITVVYSFVGSVDYPQAKIVGVFYEPGDSIAIRPKLRRSLSVTTSVNFQDVTEPPLMRVPRWPVLSITLPKDFFYPFTH